MKEAEHTTDIKAEEKIKIAARKIFLQKGFSATRTRDISEEAGINLALLNYYFRSKQKLFDQIMAETLQSFTQAVIHLFNNETTTFEKKIEEVACAYIDLLIREPQVPLFIVNEMKTNPDNLAQTMNSSNIILHSTFANQYKEGVKSGRYAKVNMVHFMANLMGLIVFPFIGNPILKKIGNLTDAQYINMMRERKQLIPTWVDAILKAK